ncbi:hypothetical protein TorRG33x02_005210 [Trema orientale]|uniref:Nucleoporin n=1 Tax=Trema orientale TaxID=63057 RepID=A0A2P5FZV1_TREOI|nr:hypothetical protein TorRG33x02_005210 [Trema orientale]
MEAEEAALGEPSSSAFGPPSCFCSTTNFYSQTGSSILGGTSTGSYGANQSSSPFSTTATFGASSSPAFETPKPPFGAFSTPSSSFCGFNQKSVSEAPFIASSQPVFGAMSSPAFDAASAAAIDATSASTFGATLSSDFGGTHTSFGVSSMPLFGSGGTFCALSTPTSLDFGSTRTSFSISSTMPLFGSGGTLSASSSPAFGASCTPVFGPSTFGASSKPASQTFGIMSTSNSKLGKRAHFGTFYQSEQPACE